MWKKIKPYVVSILIALGVGGLSAFLTRNGMDVYANINQPSLAPPGFIFPIVWTILFTLMGISSAIVFKNYDEKPDEVYSALKVYSLQLIVNFFWSIIFFNMQAYLFAFIWLILLLILIVIMIIEFKKVSNVAAYLQTPYLLWVIFATYLTYMIYILNK